MKIRAALASDAQNIADIHTTSWRETYHNALTAQYLADIAPKERNDIWTSRLNSPKPNQYVAIAEQDGELLGFACAYAGENPEWGSYLDNLHVRKTHQGNGIGKALLIEISRWCQQQEPSSGLCLLVNQNNVNAQEFYKSLGAHNAQESVWNAPDGSAVPTYWFVWDRGALPCNKDS
ncbi:GNAT family N-acetyltransferase [Marinimicrobium sp. ABcell2]|uniref:GNAT family N-acetyltransferase n=1 Tax=Marinimicrobium sp. ABcell2 TaxID=3069751 RepID=UPI0027B2389B|nr:GNAT family N-acetyltransferase [Marinimicrobium sp. ABcell2]MDQ2075899.1 GNAT family N-acetyltransferase [Marinimicrobium sp. ABcell2]